MKIEESPSGRYTPKITTIPGKPGFMSHTQGCVYEGERLWTEIHPNPDGTVLAVPGCYWGSPMEMILVDFANPMQPPWLILDRDEDEHFCGWSADGTCNIGRRFEVVDIEGHPLHGKKEDDCTIDELEQVEAYAQEHDLPEGPDGEDPGWRYQTESHVWVPPVYSG